MPPHGHGGPPRTVLLVHGAGSGPWIFEAWADMFPATTLRTVDLQDYIDIRRASMSEYVNAIARAAQACPRPLAAVAWSMGGLVTMIAARTLDASCIVAMEPSPPAEIQGRHPRPTIDPDTFDPDAAYGSFPPGIRSRPESSQARAERKTGISVPKLPCPSLVVSGSEFPVERGSRVAALYGSDELCFPWLDHWGLVLDRRVRAAVAAHLGFVPSTVGTLHKIGDPSPGAHHERNPDGLGLPDLDGDVIADRPFADRHRVGVETRPGREGRFADRGLVGLNGSLARPGVRGRTDVYVELCPPIREGELVWLGEVADRSGLTAGFSQVLASAPRRRHDPGVTLVQLLSSRR